MTTRAYSKDPKAQYFLVEHSKPRHVHSFAADVAWGGPFGATVTGYEALHSIHQMVAHRPRHRPIALRSRSRASPAPDVAIAQVLLITKQRV